MVLLELTRQLTTYDKIQKGKKKLGLQFPISVREGKTEVCPCLKVAERSSNELHFFCLLLYHRRNDFDPYNKISSVARLNYQHKFQLEDFWANASDKNEI